MVDRQSLEEWLRGAGFTCLGTYMLGDYTAEGSEQPLFQDFVTLNGKTDGVRRIGIDQIETCPCPGIIERVFSRAEGDQPGTVLIRWAGVRIVKIGIDD